MWCSSPLFGGSNYINTMGCPVFAGALFVISMPT